MRLARWIRMLLCGGVLLARGAPAFAQSQFCVGDCDDAQAVSRGNILTLVQLALGGGASDACTQGDADFDGRVSVDEILTAVRNAAEACAVVVTIPPTPPPPGPVVAGTVLLPNGQVSRVVPSVFERLANVVVAQAVALTGTVSPVGRNVLVRLTGPGMTSTTAITNDQGLYRVTLPSGTTEDTCAADSRFMMAAGTTRAFVDSTSASVDIDFVSETAVALIHSKVEHGVGMCQYTAAFIRTLVDALRACPGVVNGSTEAEINASALALAASCGNVQALLDAGFVTATPEPTTTPTPTPTTSGTVEEFIAQASDFECLTNWNKVRHYRIDNKLGHLAQALAVASGSFDVSGLEFPIGTIIQLIPGEAMVKRGGNFDPENRDWEYFAINATRQGTQIAQRGRDEVRGGACFGCHSAARAYDFVCENAHGCVALGLTDELVEFLQDNDPRCAR